MSIKTTRGVQNSTKRSLGALETCKLRFSKYLYHTFDSILKEKNTPDSQLCRGVCRLQKMFGKLRRSTLEKRGFWRLAPFGWFWAAKALTKNAESRLCTGPESPVCGENRGHGPIPLPIKHFFGLIWENHSKFLEVLTKIRENTFMRSRLLVLIIASIAAFSCGSPQNQAGSNGKPADPNKKVKIGFSMATVKEERWQRDRDAFEVIASRSTSIAS